MRTDRRLLGGGQKYSYFSSPASPEKKSRRGTEERAGAEGSREEEGH